ncbi:MAG: hypothetical protein HY822_04800 [Acidobacteria bacterium]|nr:hypothetical protein [Acidobacteriota bacterium]
MLLAFLLLAGVADWVPARWHSADPKSLELVAQTPINCLLLERAAWKPEFLAAATSRSIVTLGVIRPGEAADDAAGLTGWVLEGDFQAPVTAKLPVIELPLRSAVRPGAPVAGTFQGLWPGIHVEKDGVAKAAPTGAPWIDTNAGYLRFLRSTTAAPMWIACTPPPKNVIPVERYLTAIGDAAMAGARWVLSLDPEFEKRLLAGDDKALAAWRRIAAHLKFYEDHKDWRDLRPAGQLAIVLDPATGALLSGGILDMIGARQIPVRPVPESRLTDEAVTGAKLAVNVTGETGEVLRRFTRGGGTLLTPPPGWKLPTLKPGDITLDEKELGKLDTVFRDVNSLVGRRNLGVRLFNVSSMLSSFTASAGGKRLVLHLVNYSAYPVEDITVHLLGRHTRARLLQPEFPPKDLSPYPIEDGIGLEISRVATVAALEIE